MINVHNMTRYEWEAFLRSGTRTGKLSVNLPSGRPTVVPVWFIYGDDGNIRIETGSDSAKARALRSDPRACVVVDMEEPPYAFVKIDATARIIDDPELTLRVATDVGARYMGIDRAQEFGQRNGGRGQIVIELTPTRIVAINGIAE